MDIVTVPCLRDNFAYLIVCPETGAAGIVDPSESEPVLAAIKEHDVKPVAVLNTHHHWDHVGGNSALLEAYPNLAIYGYAGDQGRIPGQTQSLQVGDEIAVGNLRGTITHNPGHTSGAITFYFKDAAFTGDTMFAAGCGRLFEGTAEEMYQSLNQTIGGHAPETRIFFGHEYTENNLRFALSVEPENRAAQERLTKVREMRAAGHFTTPSNLADEWATNPFMRCDSPEIKETVRREVPNRELAGAEVMGVLRAMKDRF